MQLFTELPKTAENGSMWLVFRESGSVTQTVLVDGVLHVGNTGFELNESFGDYGCHMYDPVTMYAEVIRPIDL